MPTPLFAFDIRQNTDFEKSGQSMQSTKMTFLPACLYSVMLS
jgi:hypothetical protein